MKLKYSKLAGYCTKCGFIAYIKEEYREEIPDTLTRIHLRVMHQKFNKNSTSARFLFSSLFFDKISTSFGLL